MRYNKQLFLASLCLCMSMSMGCTLLDLWVTPIDSADNSSSPNNSNDSNHPTDPNKPPVHDSDTCLVADEASLATLDCDGEVITSIAFAHYGPLVGNCATGFAIGPDCAAEPTAQMLDRLCLGEPTCSFHASAVTFGDVCPGEFKELAVVYECGERPDTCVVEDEASDAVLDCGDEVIGSITFASYGTPEGSCSQGFSIDPECNYEQSTQIVEDACLGESSCSIQVSNATFEDACPNIPKRLVVDYSCEPPPDLCADVECPSPGICEVSTCAPDTGQCGISQAPDGTECELDDFCKWEDTCTAGVCDGIVTDCGPATLDSVLPSTGLNVGGEGGARSNVVCPSGYIPKGISAATGAGAYVDNLRQFQLLCSPLAILDGVLITGATEAFPTTPLGTYNSGSQARELVCPDRQIMVGLDVHFEDDQARYLTTLGISCQEMRYVDGELSYVGDATTHDRIGSSNGRQGYTRCGAEQRPYGFSVYSGYVLDGIAARCTLPAEGGKYTTSPPKGGPDGVPFTIGCRPDEVAVGIRAGVSTGQIEGALAGLQLECAPAHILPDDRVVIDASYSAGPPTGSADAAIEPALCPPGEIMIGFAGETPDIGDGYLSKLQVRCAKATAAGRSLAWDTISDGPTIGTRDTNPFGAVDCPPGTIMRALTGMSGLIVDSVSVQCTAPRLPVR